MKYQVLDLFCGAGGAAKGLKDAGLEIALGIDIEVHKNYPYSFVQGDAVHPPVKLEDFDLIWASPPCQNWTPACEHLRQKGKVYPDFIPEVLAMLRDCGVPYVIENVPAAPIREDLYLTGGMFNKPLERKRIFEISGFRVEQPTYRKHLLPLCTVAGSGRKKNTDTMRNWNKAMGIDWMIKRDLVQAVPPFYSQFIGEAFIRCM
jgi:DNA (cytosine-5)-methyltransferase 1